jgi:hypothetical protein
MKQECTSTNIKLSTLNIKYYNFGSSFDTIEFCSGNVHIDAEVIHSMIQGQHLALRCHPHKWSMRTGSPQPLSLDHSLVTTHVMTGRERRTTCTS